MAAGGRERALIEAIAAALGRREGSRVVRWLGDDAAVVRAGALAVISVDVMVDGTHFRLGQASAADAGHRALAAALSDLAAMGAAPGEAYLGVVLPAGLPDADVLALHGAAEALAAATGTTIAGGDLVAGPALTIAVTVVGWAESEDGPRRARRRAPGRPDRRDRHPRRGRGGPGRAGGRRSPRRRSSSSATCGRCRACPRGARWRGSARTP